MRADFNVYNSTSNNSHPTFGMIHYEGAEDTLRKVLSSADLKTFRTMVNNRSQDRFVNLILFGNGKKLAANVADGEMLKGEEIQCKSYSQHFWESAMDFITRMIKKVDKRTPEVEELVAKQDFDFKG